MHKPIITLLTDFGLRDHYVGVMKGIILGICPDASIIDITHGLAPQAISDAAFILGCSYPCFPAGTVHLAVVDPGVGSDRRALAARCGEHFFVGPDNGIMSYALADASDWRAVAITNPDYRLPEVSDTFHGRDIFAPAAAHLAAGVALEVLGPAVNDPVRIEIPQPRETADGLEVHVLHVDHFGNVITDLTRQRLAAWLAGISPDQITIQAGPATLRGIQTSYQATAPGRPAALIGSADRLEIAVNRGRAQDVLGLERGDSILLRKSL